MAGGVNQGYPPVVGGVVLATGDGGRTWHRLRPPANAQTACFSDSRHGWWGPAARCTGPRTAAATGRPLTSMTGAPRIPVPPAEMSVECASRRHRLGAAHWPRGRDEPGPARRLPREPVGGATAIFAEQYFQTAGSKPAGGFAGPRRLPRSRRSTPPTAAFIDWCSACGYGTASSGTSPPAPAPTSAKKGNVGADHPTRRQPASCPPRPAGWPAPRPSTPASGHGQDKGPGAHRGHPPTAAAPGTSSTPAPGSLAEGSAARARRRPCSAASRFLLLSGEGGAGWRVASRKGRWRITGRPRVLVTIHYQAAPAVGAPLAVIRYGGQPPGAKDARTYGIVDRLRHHHVAGDPLSRASVGRSRASCCYLTRSRAARRRGRRGFEIVDWRPHHRVAAGPMIPCPLWRLRASCCYHGRPTRSP